MTLVYYLCIAGLAWCVFTVVLRLLSAAVTLRCYARESIHTALLADRSDIGITIIRPMKGLDPRLDLCLASAFEQDYDGPVEILLAVADSRDPAIAVAEAVIARYPQIDARLLIGAVEIGPNPKVCNLVNAWSEAKYEVRWMLDANVWVHPGTLRRSAHHFHNDRVNLVHHIPLAHATEGGQVGAQLDDVYLGTMHARMYAFINYCNIAPCVMGKSNLLRAGPLNEVSGGIRAFAKYIAEDHMIACALWTGRGSHVLANDPVRQPLARVSMHDFAERRIRWVRVRKYMELASTMVEPFIEVVPSALIGFTACLGLSGVRAAVSLFVAAVVGSMYVDRQVWQHLHRFRSDEVPAEIQSDHDTATWCQIYLRREGGALWLWLRAVISDRIRWRGAEFVLGKDLVAVRVS